MNTAETFCVTCGCHGGTHEPHCTVVAIDSVLPAHVDESHRFTDREMNSITAHTLAFLAEMGLLLPETDVN